MKYILLCLLFVALPVHADSYNERAHYIAEKAHEYGINPQVALYIADRESGLNPVVCGDFGTSCGTWQIHLPAHQDISESQAKNFYWSTEWAMKQLALGMCKIWSTCPIQIE